MAVVGTSESIALGGDVEVVGTTEGDEDWLGDGHMAIKVKIVTREEGERRKAEHERRLRGGRK